MPAFTPFAHYTEPLAAQILRRHMGSKKNFISLILQSSSLVLTFIASLVQSFETQELLRAAWYANGFDADAVASASIGSIVGSIIGVVISTAVGSLGLVALWMIFAAARSRKSPMGTGGFTMQKILAIISMALVGVYVLLLILFLSLFSFVLDLAMAFIGSAEAALALDLVGGVMLVIFIVVIAVAFGYSTAVTIASLITANRMKATARTGLPGKPIPMFFIVTLFLEIAGCALSVLLTLPATMVAFNVGSLLLVLAYIPTIVSGVLRAMVLLGYRKELRELQNFTPSNAYVPAPAAPAVPTEPAAPAAPAEPAPVVEPLLRPYAAEEKAQPAPPPAPAEKITCPHCGAEHAKDARFCGSCGETLQ